MPEPVPDPVTVEWVELEQAARAEDLAVAERILACLLLRFLASQEASVPRDPGPCRKTEPT